MNVPEIIDSAIDTKKFIIGYRVLNKLTEFIKRHKDKNSLNINNVVYKVFCNDCDAFYVGQTKRQLTKINEYVRSINYEGSRHSVINNHILEKTTLLTGIIKKF